jgi:hypothetical protein
MREQVRNVLRLLYFGNPFFKAGFLPEFLLAEGVLTRMNHRPIHHVCYIVDDIPKAVDQWVEATGAGPFFHLGELPRPRGGMGASR